MKNKDLIKALQRLDPEADVKVVIKQYNQRWGKVVPIDYGHKSETGNPDYDEYNYLGTWVNASYGGSITVHLPEKAIISRWPKDTQ